MKFTAENWRTGLIPHVTNRLKKNETVVFFLNDKRFTVTRDNNTKKITLEFTFNEHQVGVSWAVKKETGYKKAQVKSILDLKKWLENEGYNKVCDTFPNFDTSFILNSQLNYITKHSNGGYDVMTYSPTNRIWVQGGKNHPRFFGQKAYELFDFAELQALFS
jgi:hypothetical protein